MLAFTHGTPCASGFVIEFHVYYLDLGHLFLTELDFLFISINHGIVPIEVKSGDSSRLKSFQLFMQNSPSEIAIRFWENMKAKIL
jgi:hypothetical protein